MFQPKSFRPPCTSLPVELAIGLIYARPGTERSRSTIASPIALQAHRQQPVTLSALKHATQKFVSAERRKSKFWVWSWSAVGGSFPLRWLGPVARLQALPRLHFLLPTIHEGIKNNW